MNDNDITPLVYLFIIGIVAIVSITHGFGMGEASAQRETISYCVEQPIACKTKYDDYKLEAKK